MLSERAERLLGYLEDEGWWEQWRMEGKLSPQRAASTLPLWLSVPELTRGREETFFWTYRAAIFYTKVQWANHVVHGEWGEPAKFLPWNSVLEYLKTLKPENGLLFFPGKFRALPTAGHADTIVCGRKWCGDTWHQAASVLIFEPKVNVQKIEGNKLVFDPKIRAWAYSLLPVDVVTSYPEMQEGEDPDSFYLKRNAEIRTAFSGLIGAGIGTGPNREKAIKAFERSNINVVDTTIKYEGPDYISGFDTTGLDQISSSSELVEKLILSYLRHMGQI